MLSVGKLLRRALLFVILLALMQTAASPCVFLPTAEMSKAESRHWSRNLTKVNRRDASKRLLQRSVDVADELSEMLVPNVRAIYLTYSSCGPEGEVDFAGGAKRDNNAGIVHDPRLAGINLSGYRRLIREDHGESAFGPACNAEFRDAFSRWLKATMTESELRSAWLFLTPRTRTRGRYGSTYHRLISFARETRRPPVQWWAYDEWIRRDIDRFTTRHAVGRRLSEVMSMFWKQREPTLESDAAVCPHAQATLRDDRDRLIETILSKENAR